MIQLRAVGRTKSKCLTETEHMLSQITFHFKARLTFWGASWRQRKKDIKTNLLSQDRFDISTHTAELQSNWSDCEFSIYLAVSPCR